MKFISKEKDDKQSILTIETGSWPFKKKTKYKSHGNQTGLLRTWLKLPENIEVNDLVIIGQLNIWDQLNG
jgi:hypothetical protein